MIVIDDLTYLGMVAALTIGILVAADHHGASRIVRKARNSMILVTVALYAANIANVKSNNYLGIPSVTEAVNCGGHGCPDYLSLPGVNPASLQTFAGDALLMFGAVVVGYLVVAVLPRRRLTTDAV